jgi:hypothetical protein
MSSTDDSATDSTRLKEAVEELDFLNEVARRVGQAGSIQAEEAAIISACVERLTAEQGAMWRMAGAAGDPLKTVHRVFEGGIPGLPIRLNLKILSWISANSASLLSNDVAADPRFDHGKDGPPKGLTSILAVPLFQHGQITGLLALVNSRRPGGFTESDRRLLGIIGIQCAQLLEKARQEKEEERLRALEKDLEMARMISVAPARRVAGGAGLCWRLYDRRRSAATSTTPRQATVRAVADVTGKGMPACLFMVSLLANIRAQAGAGVDPAVLMAGLNLTLLLTMTPGMFITMFWASLDVTTGVLRYSNGGHNPGLLLRAGGEAEWLTEGGTILGMLQGLPYACGETVMHPGDRLVLYSDGVTEAMNGGGELFDEEGLLRVALTAGGQPPAELIQTVLAAVKAHEGGLPPGDDKTLLITARE